MSVSLFTHPLICKTKSSFFRLFTIDSEKSSAEKLGFHTETIIPDPVEKYDDKIVLRWGKSTLRYNSQESHAREFSNVLNTSASIRKNVQKDQALRTIGEVTKTPKVFLAGEKVPEGLKVVYRFNEHTGGKNFEIKYGPFTVEHGKHASQWVPNTKEWRVWWVGDNVMGCTRWHYKEGLDPNCKSEYGYSFKRVPESLKIACNKARKAIGLDVGCSDVIEYKGEFYVLENNSAPTLDSRLIINFYRKHILEMAKEKFPDFFRNPKPFPKTFLKNKKQVKIK